MDIRTTRAFYVAVLKFTNVCYVHRMHSVLYGRESVDSLFLEYYQIERGNSDFIQNYILFSLETSFFFLFLPIMTF